MTDPTPPLALQAEEVPPRCTPSLYPPEFAKRVEGRIKRVLGDPFGLRNFGVNLTSLAPGAFSALRHSHSKQDEFIYILQGRPTLITEHGETELRPGSCAGFRAGGGDAHHLHNRSDETVVYLEVGDRSIGDSVHYPDDDIRAVFNSEGKWLFTHKDGSAY